MKVRTIRRILILLTASLFFSKRSQSSNTSAMRWFAGSATQKSRWRWRRECASSAERPSWPTSMAAFSARSSHARQRTSSPRPSSSPSLGRTKRSTLRRTTNSTRTSPPSILLLCSITLLTCAMALLPSFKKTRRAASDLRTIRQSFGQEGTSPPQVFNYNIILGTNFLSKAGIKLN
jgi:hypothetical protein